MQITEVKVFPINEEKLKAFVSVVFDGCFMVNDIKVIRGRDGLFISMPSRKKKNGEFKDVAHPLNNETRRMIETQILSEYDRMLAERGTEEAPSAGSGYEARPANGHAEPLGERSPEPLARPLPPMALPPRLSPPMMAAAAPAPSEPEGRTLEEIEELHLRDSFWTVS
jgi:stage V sporulation protein G